MTFNSPEYFILLPALVLAGWFWRGLKLHTPFRALILLVAVIALTDPVLRKQKNALDLHVLLDRSESTEDLIDRGLPEWQRILESAKPGKHDRLILHNYASEVAEVGADGAYFTGSRKLTKTGLALQSVTTQLDPSRPARVLLFTDGYSTEPLQEAAAKMVATGTPLDYRLIREEVSNDYRITRMALPSRVQAGEPFLISIMVRGSGDGTFPLTLSRNGTLLTQTTVTLENGIATVEFTDRIPSGGSYEYSARIQPEVDAHPGNNTISKRIEVTGDPSTIIVATRYEDDAVVKSLIAQNFTVKTINDLSLLQPGLLTGAKAVIFNNVPAHEIPADFMKALDFFVREQGNGFLMVGGERSFGSGGYFQSPLDHLLPVSMELKSEHRKLSVALAIVLDRSGSMSVGVGGNTTKMDLANSGAAKAVELLGAMDQIAVFAVDSSPTKVIPLTSIGGNTQQINGKILKITSAGGGIFVYEGLKAAWDELKKSKSGTQHIILFSDAQDTEEPGDYKNLLKEITEKGGSVSVIGLGRSTDVDAPLLEEIAKLGNGRAFFSDEPMDIPAIFAQETVTIARSSFIKDPVGAQATGRWSEISPKAVDWLKQVDGYNLSYARNGSTVSMVSADEYVAPLIAHSRQGLGRTAAISFPLAGEYSQASRSWSGYGDFIQTMGRFLLGDELPPGIAIRSRVEGTRLSVDLLYDEQLWADRLAAVPPKGRLSDDTAGGIFDVAWRRIAPGHFSLTRDLDEGSIVRGAVQIGQYALPFGPITVGTDVEWAFDPQGPAELKAVSGQTGGRNLLDLTTAWVRPPHIAETSLFIPLGVLLVLLIIADALVTRTGWAMPEFALPRLPKKSAKPARIKPVAKPSPAPVSPPQKSELHEPGIKNPPPPTEESSRSERFQRAKGRK